MSSVDPSTWKTSKKHGLVILPLKGALIYRPRQSICQSRPHLHRFLDTIFPHFHVMVWSSAMRRNVDIMLETAFAQHHRDHLTCIWDRRSFGLSNKDYYGKVVTIKDLNKIKRLYHNRSHEFKSSKYIILLEDDKEKVRAEDKDNLVYVNKWESTDWKDDTLLQLAEWFDELVEAKEMMEEEGKEWDFQKYNVQHPFNVDESDTEDSDEETEGSEDEKDE